MERNAEDREPRPLVGMGVLVMRGNKVLLGKRLGAHGAGYYAAPGGHIELGESLAETAVREVQEECGLQVEDIRLLTVGTYIWDENKHYVDVDVVCSAPAGEPQTLEPYHCEGWDWYDLDKLPAPLFIVTQNMIASLRAGRVVPALDVVSRQASVAPEKGAEK